MVGVEFVIRRIAPPAGPPPGDLVAQVRRQPQAPHRRAQRRRSGGGNKSLLLLCCHPRHPAQCPPDLLPGRSGDQSRYGGGLEVQCLGSVPCRWRRAWSPPKRTSGELGAGLGSSGSGALGLRGRR
jgi:hypothetical protein